MNTPPTELIFVAGEAQADLEPSEVHSTFLESVENLSQDCPVKIRGVSDTSVGRGADAFAILVSIIGIGWLVFSNGKKIEENLEAWIRMAHRVRDWLSAIKEKHGCAFISEDIAFQLCLCEIAQHSVPTKLEMISSTVVLYASYGLVSERATISSSLDSQPYRLYTFQIIANEREVHHFCIRSNRRLIYHQIEELQMPDYDFWADGKYC